jgi:hypothetical protein
VPDASVRTAQAGPDDPQPAPAPPPPGYAPAPPPPGYAPPPPGYGYAPPPSSGVGLIVTGSIFIGVGVLNLALAPVCKTDAVSKSSQDVCLYASLGVGIGFTAVGIPLAVVGGSRRRAYNRWRQSHPVMATLAEGLQLTTGHDRAGLALGGSF